MTDVPYEPDDMPLATGADAAAPVYIPDDGPVAAEPMAPPTTGLAVLGILADVQAFETSTRERIAKQTATLEDAFAKSQQQNQEMQAMVRAALSPG